jgi:hypothetical protein
MPRRHRLRVHKSPLHRSKRSRRRARLDGDSGAARAFQPLESRLYLNAAPTANDQYISGLFADLLNRPATAADVSSFSSQLDSGIGSLIPGGLLGSLSSTLGSILGEDAAARVPVALEIMDSAEFDTAAVQNAFSSLLGRQADPGAFTAFAGFLSSGGSLAQLDALIAGSPEYFQSRGKGTTDGFLDALYHDALARAPDAAGLASFTTALASGYSDQAVANFIFGSSEFQSDWISGLYGHFADRAPTAAELQSSTLILHVAGEKAALAGILANGSSYGVLSDHANGLYVTEMYRDLLQRDPDTASLNAWENALDSGTLQGGDIAHDILTSAEYKENIVQNVYSQYLGRAADPSGMAYFTNLLASGAAPEDVAAYIAGSPEYLQQHTQGTMQSFLQSFYQDTFGAPLSGADPALVASLNLQLSPQKLAESILSSPTYHNAVVSAMDAHLLGRAASPTDTASGSALLAANHGDSAFITSIVTSPEYVGLKAAAAVAPGTFTVALLGETQVLLHNAQLDAQSLAAASGGTLNNTALINSLGALRQDARSIQQTILPLTQQTSGAAMALSASDKLTLQAIDQQTGADSYLRAIPNLINGAGILGGIGGAVAGGLAGGLPGALAGYALGHAVGGLAAAGLLYYLAHSIQKGQQNLESQDPNPGIMPNVDNTPAQVEPYTDNSQPNPNSVVPPSTNSDITKEIASLGQTVPQQTIDYNDNAPKINQNLPANPPRDSAPDIGLSDPDLSVETTEGETGSETEYLSIENDTSDDSTLDGDVTPYDPQVIHVGRNSTGDVPSGGTSTIDVSIDPADLPPGNYDEGIVISDPNAANGEVFVPVDITVNPPGVIPPQVGGAFGAEEGLASGQLGGGGTTGGGTTGGGTTGGGTTGGGTTGGGTTGGGSTNVGVAISGPASAGPNQDVIYTVTVTNTGSGVATSVPVHFEIDSPQNAFAIASETASQGTPTSDGRLNVDWQIPSLAPGASATLTVDVQTVNNPIGALSVDVYAGTPSNDKSLDTPL